MALYLSIYQILTTWIYFIAADNDGLLHFVQSNNLGSGSSNVVNLTHSEIFDSDAWMSLYQQHLNMTPQHGKRSKRSVGNGQAVEKQYVVCPPLDGFEIMSYESLACPELILTQESKYTAISAKRVLPISLVEKPRVCTCMQQKHVRWCFKRFFDSDEKSEKVIRLEPVRGHCQELCDEMINQGKVELTHGSVPGYSCWWMKGTTVEGVVTKIQAINVVLNKLTMEVTNQFFQNGKCIWGSLDCRFQGGAYVIFPAKSEPDKKLVLKDYSTESFDYREIKGSDMILLRSKVAKTVYNVKKCCIRYGSSCLAPSIRGHLFDVTALLAVLINKMCPESWASITPPLSSGIIQDPDVRELHKEEMFCHLTKQSILNSVKVGVALSKRLLSVFNHENTAGVPSKFLYYLSGKSLVRAKCITVTYDEVVYHCPDIWVLKKMGSAIACYDARANIAFAAKCQCYPEVSARYIMNEYVVRGTNGTYTLDKYKYPESDVVEELNLLAQGYKDLLSYIQTPSGIIIYDNPIIKGTQEDAFTNQTYAAVNLFGDFFGWFRNIKSAFITIITIALICLGIYFMIKIIKCKKNQRQRNKMWPMREEEDTIYSTPLIHTSSVGPDMSRKDRKRKVIG